MPAEILQPQPENKPDTIVKNYLYNKEVLHILLGGQPFEEKKEEILDKIAHDFTTFNEEETKSLVSTLLNGLARDDKEWNVDRRDGALEILQLIDFSKIDKKGLLKLYLDNVSTQTSESDPYGSIYSLSVAGEIMAYYFPIGEDTKIQLASTWNRVSEYFKDEDYVLVQKHGVNVVESVPELEDALGDLDIGELGRREKARFDHPEQELHDKYVEVNNKKKTFKFALWDNTPEFRELCKKYGIPLEKFWNFNNPDDISIAIDKIRKQDSDYIKANLNRELKKEIGIELNELTPEKARVVGDEIIKAANSSAEILRKSVGDFAVVINLFKDLTNAKRDFPKKAQQATIKPIINFLKENGYGAKSAIIDQVEAVLNDEKIMSSVKKEFEKKQQQKIDAAQTIENIFNLSQKTTDFSLSSRTKDDLFLGDITGDCTAYHLNIGMNVWTVPIWLSNPGFNFFKISENNQLIAKLGILLAVADEKPALVIDSMEVAKGIKNDESAKEQLNKGLKFLNEWAYKIGLSRIYVQNFSNSSELMPFIETMSKKSKVDSLSAIGGLSGIAELRQNLIGTQSEERIYLQSINDEYDPEQRDVNGGEKSFLGEFENIIKSTINRAGEKEVVLVENMARTQDWPGLFQKIIELNYPYAAKIIGSDWITYKGFMDGMLIIHKDQVSWTDEESRSSHESPISRIINEKIIEEETAKNKPPDDDELENDPRMKEIEKIEDLLMFLSLMREINLSPEYFLKKLYGESNMTEDLTKEEQRLNLNLNLPILIA